MSDIIAIKPLKNNIFVSDLESGGRKLASGIILMDDNMKETGIRSRWGRVYSFGPDIDYLVPGEWVLVEHGRWTTSIDVMKNDGSGESFKIWKIDPDAILLVSDTDPREYSAFNGQ